MIFFEECATNSPLKRTVSLPVNLPQARFLLVIYAYYAAKRAEAMDKTAIAAAETLEIGRKNKEESHLGDSLDHQGASINLIMALRDGGCHPLFIKS